MDGLPVHRLSGRELAQRIGYVPQACEFADSSVFDAVLLGRKPFLQWDVTKRDLEIVQDVLRRMDLEECAHREVNALSGGERQKVSIARALAQQAPVLLFDEPTSSLDLRNQLEVLDMTKQVVRQQGLAAVVILHDLNLALRFADRFLVMKEGAGVRFWGPGSGGPGDDLGRVRRPGPGAASERAARWWSPNECCERSFFMRRWRKGAGVFCGGGPGDKSGPPAAAQGKSRAVRRRLPPGETPWR